MAIERSMAPMVYILIIVAMQDGRQVHGLPSPPMRLNWTYPIECDFASDPVQYRFNINMELCTIDPIFYGTKYPSAPANLEIAQGSTAGRFTQIFLQWKAPQYGTEQLRGFQLAVTSLNGMYVNLVTCVTWLVDQETWLSLPAGRLPLVRFWFGRLLLAPGRYSIRLKSFPESPPMLQPNSVHHTITVTPNKSHKSFPGQYAYLQSPALTSVNCSVSTTSAVSTTTGPEGSSHIIPAAVLGTVGALLLLTALAAIITKRKLRSKRSKQDGNQVVILHYPDNVLHTMVAETLLSFLQKACPHLHITLIGKTDRHEDSFIPLKSQEKVICVHSEGLKRSHCQYKQNIRNITIKINEGLTQKDSLFLNFFHLLETNQFELDSLIHVYFIYTNSICTDYLKHKDILCLPEKLEELVSLLCSSTDSAETQPLNLDEARHKLLRLIYASQDSGFESTEHSFPFIESNTEHVQFRDHSPRQQTKPADLLVAPSIVSLASKGSSELETDLILMNG